jgi:pimeloyl-ACP methyl ester carboxylesterase
MISLASILGKSFHEPIYSESDLSICRGIGRTEPKVQLFSDPAEKAAWDLRHEAAQPLNATPDALARDVARWSVFGDLAAERLAHPAQYVSTAFVARDMARMAEAHGESRVRYWGFSYGSVLGITFAAMFPDKVERLIVDGVCDTDNYYESKLTIRPLVRRSFITRAAQWSNNLRDTDAGLRLFYEACAAAGPDACALHMSTADEVQTRTQKIFAGLKQRPIPVVAPVNTTSAQLEYGLVDYKMARSLVFTFLYGPYSNTPRAVNATVLATVLAGAEARNGRPLWDVNKATLTELKCGCDKSGTPVNMVGRETGLAVACSDGDVVEDSIDELQTQYEGMAKFSDFAELWGMRVSCSYIFFVAFPHCLADGTA